MRIIGGERRGKKLLAVPGMKTRPTADRVKETLFNIIQMQVKGAKVLDLFSGTGALGLEALSRGAARCTFVDSAKAALEVCQKNICGCGFEEKSEVIFWDISRSLTRLEHLKGTLDLIFLDPPYKKGLADKALEHIAASQLPAKEALIVVEHAAGDPPNLLPGLTLKETRKYGTTELSFIYSA